MLVEGETFWQGSPAPEAKRHNRQACRDFAGLVVAVFCRKKGGVLHPVGIHLNRHQVVEIETKRSG
jgi:hypothetical protein